MKRFMMKLYNLLAIPFILLAMLCYWLFTLCWRVTYCLFGESSTVENMPRISMFVYKCAILLFMSFGVHYTEEELKELMEQ